MVKETIKVEGMSCKHCKLAVENAVKSLNGVRDATVNLDEGVVDVEFEDGTLNSSQIVDAINNTEIYKAHV